jgi:hypothetical protein
VPIGAKPGMSGHFYYLTGCDGTGKSTQAKLLLESINQKGKPPIFIWLRYPFLLSVPLLFYARIRGFSWVEIIKNEKYGYWDFNRSKLLRLLLPWTLLADSFLAALIKIYIPLFFGRDIVCERFVVDMLADLMVAFNNYKIIQSVPCRLYLKLLPGKTNVIMLDLDEKIVCKRRPCLIKDRNLSARLAMFRLLAQTFKIEIVLSNKSIDEIQGLIKKEFIQ